MSAPHEFKIGDVVLAKIKGFPSWPGIIMDDENVPRAVLEERPSGKSSLHTIRFFPAADYHWASARDLKLLTNEDIDTFLEGSTRKSGDLLKAYKLAKDPHKWNAEQNRIVKEANDWLEEHGDEEEEEEEVDYDNVEQLTREDFDNIMDEFLDKHEVVAGKMRPTLGTRDTTANEKLEMIRKGLGEVRLTENDEEVGTPASENPFLNPDIIGADREKWDVETIQTTKTNLENHPRTITAAESVAPSGTHAPSTIAGGGARTLGAGDVRIPKIRIHPRTGVPQVVGYTVTQKDRNVRKEVAAAEERQPTTAKGPASDEASDDEAATESLASEGVPAPPHKRDRNESKEERRARKAAVKLEKQSRRADKAATKQAFADERKRQLRAAQRQHEATGGQAAAHLT